MKYFSKLHSLQDFVLFEYAGAFPIISHLMSYSVFSLLRFQICLLSSVEFFRLSLVNDCLWFAYRNLNSVSVSPTYVSILFVFCVIVAL